MNIFLVNQDNPSATSLMEKLATNAKPGAIIPLDEDEMDLYRSDDFKMFPAYNKENSNIVEIDPSKSYVFMLNPARDNIDDAVNIQKRLGARIAIVRTRD